MGGKCVKLCTAHVSVCVGGGGVVGGKCVKLCTAQVSIMFVPDLAVVCMCEWGRGGSKGVHVSMHTVLLYIMFEQSLNWAECVCMCVCVCGGG